MATSKLQVYARLARGLGSASATHRRDPGVYVCTLVKADGTRRVLRVATRARTCVHARTLEPSECRPANARVHAPGAIPAMRNVSSRTSVRGSGKTADSLSLSLVSLLFSCLPRAITRAGIKEPLIEFFFGTGTNARAHVS